jgi:hypothetical protein
MQRRHFSRLISRTCLGLGTGLLLGSALPGCGGVPLKALPRLMQMPNQLLGANPDEFRVALQVDARLAPPAGAAPLLVVQLRPKDPAAFAAIDQKLPMQLTVTSAAAQGLDAPPNGRRWLIYSLPPASQAELRRVQSLVLEAKARPGYQGGGTLGLGVEQDALAKAITDPTLARTRWETWVQVSRADGFLEVWSGTPEEIQKLAAAKR